MIVFIPYKEHPHTGKGFFVRRLVPALRMQGVEVVIDPKDKHDLYFDAVNFKFESKAKRILRVDGVYFCKDRPYKKQNHKIKKHIKKADGIVWQSQFSRKLARTVLGVKPKKEAVIFNGADPKEFDIQPAKTDYPKNIIIAAQWIGTNYDRPHKRLKPMIKICEELCERHKDLCVWIAGKHKEKSSCDRIKMLGHISNKELLTYYKMADINLNLAHHDSCPNTVVEALVAGTPVISCWGGGVHELVEGYGVVLPLDDPFKPGFLKTDKPPKIRNPEIVYRAVEHLLDQKRVVEAKHLYINNIAKQYINFFKSVI